MKSNNVLLIGLGPHSKRIYLNFLKKNNSKLLYLLELDSKLKESRDYLDDNGFKQVKLITIPDKYKDYDVLPKMYYKMLLKLCKEENINKIIISTEPKAHHMYLDFAIRENIDVLSDKPIIVLKDMYKLKNINKMRKEYYDLLRLHENKTSQVKIMCQRLYHKGYIFVKNLLKDVVTKYNIPITYIDIYHCDGNWELPHDLDKENHPYKYGYGKLYHSGFHFIDLLAELLKINNLTTYNKRITKGYLHGNVFTPNDELAVFNKDDYAKIFPESINDKFYKNLNSINFDKYGEKNFYSQMFFYNNDNKLITTANLNLLHYGVSRRGWFVSKDFYKNNGRIRHEKINITVGPLLNIQITSCQSKEIKDRTNSIEEIYEGGLEHFDIDIYRNVDLISGKPHEKIRLFDIYNDGMKSPGFIGYNEKSRADYINSFLNNDNDIGEIEQEDLGIEIMHSASQIIKNNVKNKYELIKIDIPDTCHKEYIDIIKDENIGEISNILDNPKERIAARGIVLRKDGKIAIFNKSNKNEYKLPGGGVEIGEDVEDAFKREIKEETGCDITIIDKLGIIKEEKSKNNFQQISHVFVSRVVKDNKKLNLTDKEKDEGGKLIWVSVEKALELITNCYDKLKPSKYEDIYNTKFIVLRDKKILEYYMEKGKHE